VIITQTFTYKEKQYLLSLLERNYKKDYEGSTLEPLKIPMDVKERKLRSRIRAKCDIYIEELVEAQLAGLLPTKNMKDNKYKSAFDAIRKHCLVMTMKLHEEFEKESTDSC